MSSHRDRNHLRVMPPLRRAPFTYHQRRVGIRGSEGGGVVFGADVVDELEERGADHWVRERGTLLAAGNEHRNKSVLGGKDVSWKKLEETARNVHGT